MDEDGSSRRHTVYGNTAKEARNKAAEVRARLRANLPAKDRKITLGEFTVEWIDSSLEASDRRATTKNLYGTMARTHIIGAKIGAKPLDKLRPTHIDAWTVELKAASWLSPRSAPRTPSYAPCSIQPCATRP